MCGLRVFAKEIVRHVELVMLVHRLLTNAGLAQARPNQ